MNNTGGNGFEDYWAWSAEPDAGNSEMRVHEGEGWSAYGAKLDFQLTNDATEVAEPGTWTLLGLGLAGIGFRSRRKRAM